MKTEAHRSCPQENGLPEGSTVEITPQPSLNYEFDHWIGDVPSGKERENPLTLTMDQARSVFANFALVSHRVDVVATNGQVSGSRFLRAWDHGDVVGNPE